MIQLFKVSTVKYVQQGYSFCYYEHVSIVYSGVGLILCSLHVLT